MVPGSQGCRFLHAGGKFVNIFFRDGFHRLSPFMIALIFRLHVKKSHENFFSLTMSHPLIFHVKDVLRHLKWFRQSDFFLKISFRYNLPGYDDKLWFSLAYQNKLWSTITKVTEVSLLWYGIIFQFFTALEVFLVSWNFSVRLALKIIFHDCKEQEFVISGNMKTCESGL